MTNYVCTWCRKEVDEQHFELHTTAHYVEIQNKWMKEPFASITRTGGVAYVKYPDYVQS